jgi:hypothetical protein
LSYKIVITKQEEYTSKGKEYQNVKGEDGELETQYVPYEKTAFRDVEVLTQTVEDLDLVSVIKAVNKIAPEKN